MNGPSDSAESDGELLQRSRDGDRNAFSELWRRHAPVALAYARTLGSAPPDPEDIVSDAFLSILRQIRMGKGPQRSFRPYLLTTVRNTWVSESRRRASTSSLEEMEHPHSTIGTIDIDSMVNSAALVDAFGSLPRRWQHALWLSEVERLPARQIAEALQIRPNTAAALTYRARDALRKAWIRAHLRDAPDGTDHARVIEQLGAYAHGGLAPRSERFVTAHLAACPSCRAAAGEATNLFRALTIGPLLAGGVGLVIAPTLFLPDRVEAMTDPTASPSAAVPAQPPFDAAGLSGPLLWPVAAVTAVALAVGGSLFLRPMTETDATGIAIPSVPAPIPSTSVPAPAEPGGGLRPGVPPTPMPSPIPTYIASPPAPPAPAPITPPTEPSPTPTQSSTDEIIADGTDTDETVADSVDTAPKKGGLRSYDYGYSEERTIPTPGEVPERYDDTETLMLRPTATSWSSTVVLVSTDADSGTVRVDVRRASGTELAFVIDGQTVATMTDDEGSSSGFELTLPRGAHTLSVYYLDGEGGLGALGARTTLSVD